MTQSRDTVTSKRFLLIFASIFLLGALPLLMGHPSGAATAGLSHGFTLPIEQWYHLLVLFGLGMYASYLRGQGPLLVPLSFVLLFVVGLSLQLNLERYRLLPLFMLGAVLLFAICMMLAANRRRVIFALVIAASLGFHYGRYYAGAAPAIASPLYFMIGMILSFGLIFSTAVSFGMTMRHEMQEQTEDISSVA